MATTVSSTSFESDGVRFVYRMCDDVYIVLITSLSSNIIEDTDIMNAMIAALQQKLTVTAKGITTGMFEALFILDEFLQWGYAEKLSVSTVRTNLAMRSKDEEIYLKQLEIKKAEAERVAREKEDMIREEKELKERIKEAMNASSVNEMYMSQGPRDFVPEPSNTTPVPKKKQPAAKKPMKQKGLQLGKKKQSETIIEEIKKEEEIEEPEQVQQKVQKKEEKRLMLGAALVRLVEDSRISVSSETSAVTVSVTGSLAVAAAENTEPEIKLDEARLAVKPQLNPHIDAKAFAERVLKPKEGKRFATNNPAVYVKWNYKADSFDLPITFSCWPAEAQIGLTLSMSYDVTQSLQGVVVEIPNLGPITVVSIDGTIEEEEGVMRWMIGDVTEGSSGSMEIEIAGEGLTTESIFPVNVKYLHDRTMSGNDVLDVMNNGESVEYEKDIQINALYQILP